METIHSKKTVEISAWLAYSIIFFEMLYMSTPFAVFFYSIYEFPLKWLTSSEKTAWLVHTIFPHFSANSSVLINTLLYMSFPLMIIGFIVFLIGFVQIYHAKFKNTGAVTWGIYKYIRHPQYAAWSIFGLGMSLFWSRMIVWITYVAMLFIYFYLAHAEEQECLSKYGDDYREYMEKTGGLFPKRIKRDNIFSHYKHSFSKESISRTGRMAIVTVCFLLAELMTIGSGVLLRNHAAQSLYGIFDKNKAAVALVSMQDDAINKMLKIAATDEISRTEVQKYYSANPKQIIYIMPYGWDISELMAAPVNQNTFHDSRLFVNPSGHGNPVFENTTSYRILFSEPVCPASSEGRDILTRATKQIPRLLVDLDIQSGKVLKLIVPQPANRYGDIPVPLY